MDTEIFNSCLSLDGSEFVGHIYDLAMPVYYGDYDYDTLLSIAPDRAYVVDVYNRLNKLVERFHSQNVIYQMLAIENFPVASSLYPISREAWSRIILDVLLARLTSVRDCTYLLIAEVFELGLDPRKLSRQTLQKNAVIPNTPFHTLIDDIANIGRSLRDERDLHLHRGEQRTLSEHPIFYQSASLLELWGRTTIYTDQLGNPITDQLGNSIDVDSIHTHVIEQIKTEFTSTSENLESKLYELFDELYPVFLQRFRIKRKLSQLD